MTFEKAVDDYLKDKLVEFKNEKHQAQWRSTLLKWAVPEIGSMPIDTITANDIERVLKQNVLDRNDNSIVLGSLWTIRTETASRLRGRIENVLYWATVKKYRTGDNPARWKGNLDQLLPKPSKVAKVINQPAVSRDDIATWWAALNLREGMAAKALQFLTLCASRSGEIRGATWDEFSGLDGDNPIWTISANRMKMEKEHIVPLSPEALNILNSLPRAEGDNTVFFAPRGGPLSDMTISAVMKRMHEGETKLGAKGWVDQRSGRPAVPHGMRSTFKGWATNVSSYSRDLSEFALAHAVGDKTEQAYDRETMVEKRRPMMVDWAKFLRTGPVDNDG
jgi:integrase